MVVEIWSDVVCPWCYIGKRRFEAALAQFAQRDQVEIVWRSFELDPQAPRGVSQPLDEMLAKKMGVSLAQAATMNARVTDLAAKEGLDYHLERARPGNTFDAHRLIHMAAAQGHQAEAQERLMHAYFSDGQPIGEAETLVALGAALGLAEADVRAMLASDQFAAEVRADERRAAMFGVTGVPFFAIDEKFGVSGAQSPELFLDALQQAWADAHPLQPLGAATADVCVDDSCVVVPEARGSST